jgi:hypothetical protein
MTIGARSGAGGQAPHDAAVTVRMTLRRRMRRTASSIARAYEHPPRHGAGQCVRDLGRPVKRVASRAAITRLVTPQVCRHTFRRDGGAEGDQLTGATAAARTRSFEHDADPSEPLAGRGDQRVSPQVVGGSAIKPVANSEDCGAVPQNLTDPARTLVFSGHPEGRCRRFGGKATWCDHDPTCGRPESRRGGSRWRLHQTARI